MSLSPKITSLIFFSWSKMNLATMLERIAAVGSFTPLAVFSRSRMRFRSGSIYIVARRSSRVL